MELLREFQILVNNILYWIIAFISASAFLFFFGLKDVLISGRHYLVPLPSETSFSTMMFLRVRLDLLPPGVELITTNPMSALVTQISFSLLLGFLVTLPAFLYEIIKYLNPALLPREKIVVLFSLIPFVLLFLSGCAFAYTYLIPTTFKILYPFATEMGASPLFSLDEFIQYVIALLIGVGLMFLLPLYMILLSFLGIINSSFWWTKWRYALLFFLVLSAIMTPDGTGITMLMLFLPLMFLYFAGCFFAGLLRVKNSNQEKVEFIN